MNTQTEKTKWTRADIVFEAISGEKPDRNNVEALAEALKKLIHFEDEYYRPMPHTGGGIALKDAKKAIADYDASHLNK